MTTTRLRAFLIEDRRPLLGWTRQKLRNHALIHALIREDMAVAQKAIGDGADVNARCRLLKIHDEGEKSAMTVTPLAFCLQFGLADGAVFLLDAGARVPDRTTDLLLEGRMGQDEALLTVVGSRLVEAGWNLHPAGCGGDADFSAFDRLNLELLRERHPAAMTAWEATARMMEEQDTLRNTVPQAVLPAPARPRL